jgi:1-acyl-sn-glycerol-3-phosphate acyltransferase
MEMLAAASPALKMMFERVGRPEVTNRPALLRPGGTGAVIVCNHVGWADSLWMAYAVYPRQLHYLSKLELFGSMFTRWVLDQGGSIPIDRGGPAPSSIKTSVDLLRRGEVILIFPSGTRNQDNITFKRGAATIALHAQVPIIPAFYQGPADMHVAHLMHRPRVQLAFGPPIPTADLPIGRATAFTLTQQLRTAIEELRPAAGVEAIAAKLH